ncbi:MAG: hypothetical protein HC921_01330 [Synechococcaceae cyanobacterium SM2_3_1]|nr:hypothetical protein [Synechococcaceae cyanobacterium SM2_3_1]
MAAMTQSPPDRSDAEPLLEALRRREGNWADWGQYCQGLQKAGYTPQQIFEESGFEPGQQHQLIVGSQVFAGLVSGGASPEILAFFANKGSDILYEFRLLPQGDRLGAAALVQEKNLHVQEAHEIVRVLKQGGQRRELPQGFTPSTGDRVAHRYWQRAQQMEDLPERSRLIAKALQFVSTEAARQQVESLLTDFQVRPRLQAPHLSLYRLESQEELPRILPVVGAWPLTTADLKALPWVDPVGRFRMMQVERGGAWIALPGWPLLLKAADPVAILVTSQQLEILFEQVSDSPLNEEAALLVVDRAERDWQADQYYLVAEDQELQVAWFGETPTQSLWGQVLLVVRPLIPVLWRSLSKMCGKSKNSF